MIIEERESQFTTSDSLRADLVKWLPDMKIPNVVTLRSYLKKYLNMSFKKVSHIFIPNPTIEDRVLKAEFIYVTQTLEREGVRLIYLDEFAV